MPNSIYLKQSFVPVVLVNLGALVFFCALIDLMPQGLRFTQGFAWAITSSILLAVAGTLLARHRHWRLSAMAFASANIVLMRPFVELAHLAPAYIGRRFPFVDDMLAKWDGDCGFSWTAYFMWHAAHPAFDTICRIAYIAFPLVGLYAVLVLATYDQFERLARLLIATTLSLIFVYLVAIVTPSYGAYVQHGMSEARHPGFVVQFSNFKPTYDALRSGIVDIYAAQVPAGAISFPSFHTSTVVLYVWALWTTPVRWMIVLIQGLCLLAIPVQGAHFVIDMIAGGGIAILAIACATRLVPWPAGRTVAQPLPTFRHTLGQGA